MIRTILIAALFASPVALAGDEAPKAASFASLDADSNGELTAVEAAANEAVAKAFTKLDTDKDGAVSAEEYAAGVEKKADIAPKKAPAE